MAEPTLPAPESRPTGKVTAIGSYQLLDQLGSGGMSSVFRARHAETGLTVAVKILPRSLARNVTLLQRFLREAKNAEKLQHPNIVAIFDRGMEDGRYYLVMEYVAGGDFLDRVRLRGALSWGEAVEVIRQTAEALRYASGLGLIHRDVKPANVLMTPQGRVKVADLGLALHVEEEDERVTRDGTTVGTVDYMAPEQARDSRAASVRSDIYSLGCTFYFLLTALPPYPQGDISEKLRMHATAPVPDVRELAPDVPEAVATLIKKMMAKQADRRFADYDALLAALDELPLSAGGTPGLVALIDEEDEGSQQANARGPLAAIIDEEEDGGGDLDEVKLVALIDDEADAPKAGQSALRPTALIDDEPDEPDCEGYALAEGPGGSQVPRGSTQDLTRTGSESVFTPAPGRSGRRRAVEDDAGALGFDLAEAGESAAQPAGPPRHERPAAPGATARAGAPGFEREPSSRGGVTAPAGVITVEPPLEDVYGDLPPAPLPLREGPVDVRVWILRGLLTGATLVLVGLIGLAASRMGPFAPGKPLGGLTQGEELPPEQPAPGPGAGDVVPGDLAGGNPRPSVPPPPAAARAVVPRRPEPEFGKALWEKLSLREPAQLEAGGGKPLRIQRVTGDQGGEQVEISLQRGLESVNQSRVEIADQGPFFLDNPRLGQVRWIGGAVGFRPVLVFGGAGSASVVERSAFVVVEREPLVLNGLDIVIDAASIRQTAGRHRAWLSCRDAGVILRNCTVTVDGVPPEGWSLIEVGEPARVQGAAERGSLVRIESSTIRMSAGRLVRLHGPGQVWMDRALWIGGDDSACVEMTGSATGPRHVTWVRTTCVGAGPVLELSGSAGSAGASAVVVRAIGSQFSHLTTSRAGDRGVGGGSSFVRLSQVPGEAVIPDCLEYRGERNGWEGYTSWLAGDEGAPALLKDLNGAREKWPGTDEESQERSASSWPGEASDPWLSLEPWVERLTESAWLLERLPAPTPDLRSWTLARFEVAAVGDQAAGRGTGPVVDANFDVVDPQWGGDLGRYLAAQLARMTAKPGRLRVRVQGAGQHMMTPCLLPGDVDLELTVAADQGGAVSSGVAAPLVWVPSEQAGARPLVETQGGGLVLDGVRFHTFGNGPPAPLVRARGGRVMLRRCVFTSPMRGAATSQPLVVLEGAGGVRGIQAECMESWFSTGATALRLELAQGVVRLAHSVIMAGQGGLELVPLSSAPDAFRADLILDRVTVASERDLIRLQKWSGEPVSPARPWVISSNQSAYIDQYDHGSSPARLGVLLRADPDAFSRGVLSWQGTQDLYAIDRYLIGSGVIPDASQRHRPSYQQQWLRLWGPAHLESCLGTEVRASDLPVRLRIGKLKPGQAVRGDLELVRATPTGTQRVDVGAPLDRVPEPMTPQSRRGGAGTSPPNASGGGSTPGRNPAPGKTAPPGKSNATKSNDVVPFE